MFCDEERVAAENSHLSEDEVLFKNDGAAAEREEEEREVSKAARNFVNHSGTHKIASHCPMMAMKFSNEVAKLREERAREENQRGSFRGPSTRNRRLTTWLRRWRWERRFQ